MTHCEKCIHYDMCKAEHDSLDGTILSFFPNNEDCNFFKNKADYVEVVRCSQCKHLTVHNSPTLYAYCEKEHIRFEPFRKDTRTHFCSYGKRRDA